MSQMNSEAIVNAAFAGLTFLWTPDKDPDLPLQKQKRALTLVSAAFLAFLALFITDVRLCSALSLLASISVLGRTLSLKTANDDFAFLNAVRAIMMLFFSLSSPGIPLVCSCLFHLTIAWYTFTPPTQRYIHRYTRCVLGIEAVALVQHCTKNDLSAEDMYDEEGIKWTLRGIERIQFDTSMSYPMFRGFIAFAWRRILAFATVDTVLHLCTHYRGIVFAMIVGVVDRGNDTDSSGLFALCAAWTALSMVSVVSRSHTQLKEHAYWEFLDVIRNMFIAIRTSRNGGRLTVGEYMYECSRRSYIMVCSAGSIQSVLSQSVASILSMRLLISKVGWHAVLPVGFMVVFSGLKVLVTSKSDALRKVTGTRPRPRFYLHLQPLLQSMRTIKFYGWEQAFHGARGQLEDSLHIPPLLWRILGYLITLVESSATQLATALTVISYLQSTGTLTFTEVMVVVSSATTIASYAMSCTSIIADIQKIRDAETALDKVFDNDDNDYVERVEQVGDIAVELDDCAFQWGPDKFSLAPISLSIKAGEFSVVVGRVGSGKSSLLSAICSEMPLISGAGRTYGRIGYVSQKPWIMNATFRENILFGQEFDEKFYWRVVEACALSDDIKLFPTQDLSEIGPRGINLSGGQKARLALARAIYSRADVYVLDDLLAAVDAHVERQLIENVLVSGGIIGEKTRILVTHAEHVAPLASKVVTLTNGYATVVDQTPMVFAVSSPGSPEVDESSSSSNEASGQFILDPEISVPPFQWSYMWRYLQMSGYHIVGVAFAIQAISAYATFYVDSLRLDMVMDSNRESMVQSLQNYLLMNAFVNMLQLQLSTTERWLRHWLWSARLGEKTRSEVLDTLLHLPLSRFESLPTENIDFLFNRDRIIVCFMLPSQICRQILGALYAVNAVTHVARRMPVALTLILPTAAMMVIGSQILGVVNQIFLDVFYSDRKFNPMTSFEVVLDGQEVMRVHGVLDKHLRVCASRIAHYSNIVLHSNLPTGMTYALDSLVTALIKSALLFYHVWRASTLGLTSYPGEIEMMMRLTEIMMASVRKITGAGYDLRQELPTLSKYFVYTGLPREAPGIIEDSRPPQHWPSDGTIEFRDYSMRYRDNLDCVLHDISFSVGRNEKVGIVGRTGAGKSSLTYALLRIIEPASGAIFIDGVDVATIGLQDLRSKIGIIPQDPALFVGTIRENLDPLNEFTDDEIWVAIRKGHIEDLVSSPTRVYNENDKNTGPWVAGVGLGKWVEDSGTNFSVGQRQLISLCRALLWKRKILILDEATANVDTKTDQIMQQAIREEFRDSTILTVAHRLRTVMDSDRILVMDQGKVAEFDSPANLLARDSLFKSLVESMEFNESR